MVNPFEWDNMSLAAYRFLSRSLRIKSNKPNQTNGDEMKSDVGGAGLLALMSVFMLGNYKPPLMG